MINLYLPVLFLLFSFNTHAMNPFKIGDFKRCFASMIELTNLSVDDSEWSKNPYINDEGEVNFYYQTYLDREFESLSTVILSRQNNKIIIFISNLKTNRRLELDKNSCQVIKDEKKILELSQTDKDLFSDSDLMKLVSNKNQGIIYLWSPHMPMSIGSLKRLLHITSNKKNISVTVLLDPNASEKEVKKATIKNPFLRKFCKRNGSGRLSMQGSLNHYPSAYFFKQGKILPHQLLGAKSSQTYLAFIEKLFI